MQNNRNLGFNGTWDPNGSGAMFINPQQFDELLDLPSQQTMSSSSSTQIMQYAKAPVNVQQNKTQLKNGFKLLGATIPGDPRNFSKFYEGRTNGFHTPDRILVYNQGDSSKFPEELVSDQGNFIEFF